MGIEISVTDEYVRVAARGPLTREALQQIIKDATRVFDDAEPRPKGYLFDFRGAPNVEPPSQTLALVLDDMKKLKVDRTQRAAVLVDMDDRSHDFAEIAAANAGFIVRHFNYEGAAIGWLTSEDDSVRDLNPADEGESDHKRP